MKHNLARNHIMVLKILKQHKRVSELKAFTLREISEKTDYSYFTIRNIVGAITISGLCSKGIKLGQAETYYITQEGIEYLRELSNNDNLAVQNLERDENNEE